MNWSRMQVGEVEYIANSFENQWFCSRVACIFFFEKFF